MPPQVSIVHPSTASPGWVLGTDDNGDGIGAEQLTPSFFVMVVVQVTAWANLSCWLNSEGRSQTIASMVALTQHSVK